MTPQTHVGIDARLCGTPTRRAPGQATVALATLPEMGADTGARNVLDG